jgi:hypothetical protein
MNWEIANSPLPHLGDNMQRCSGRFSRYRYFGTLFMVAASMVLAACSDTTGSATTSATTSTASSVQMLVSSQQMLSGSNASTLLTAVVLDGNGQVISGQPVIFSKGSDSSAYFSGMSATTDANGIATATLNIGTNMANRTISLSATAGSAVGTNSVAVTGTKISISGNTSLALNATSALSIIVKDSTGVAVPGVTLTVTSQNGNPIVLSPATGITDSTGQITATVTASNAGTGTDVLTVSGAGASQTQILTINSGSFAFTAPVAVAPATKPEIVINTSTPVTVHWAVSGAPQVGELVYFSTTRGSISTNPATTDASGNATTNITANSTGDTTITASGTGGSPAATLNVVFVTTSASSITAQATPGTVAVNTSGSTAKQSVISVVVRDGNNNLVKNAHVTFNQVADASGGSLAANSAVTDITGSASVNYIAGTSFSGQNGVQIDAMVDAVNGVAITPITSSVFLTVASQMLYVRLGTDNTVSPDVPVHGVNTKKYTALVTDSAQNPVPDGTLVRFVLRPAPLSSDSFFKGFFTWNDPPKRWLQTVVDGCPNEDTSLDGILQTGEDTNVNGRLDPIGVASVNPTAATIGGFATAEISYAKEFAYWVDVELEARAGTAGNDPPSTVVFTLPGYVGDYTVETVSPPGAISPFGASTGCDNTN